MPKREDWQTLGAVCAALAISVGSVTAYFWENIRGNQRFKAYCKKEAGLRIYKKALPNKVWLADSPYSAVVAASFDGVAFARYVEASTGREVDVHHKSGPRAWRDSYAHVDADVTRQPTYGWRSIGEPMAGELRMIRAGDELYELQSGELMASYYDFGFFMFDPAKTPFSSPAPQMCLHNLSTYRELQSVIQTKE